MTTSQGTQVVRLAHFSDVHATARPLGWRSSDWFSRRVSGWINLHLLGRGRGFAQASTVLEELTADLARRHPDHVIFSGDATTLGFESELARAAALLDVAGKSGIPGMAVPGNHDYYTRSAAGSGLFERYFAAWQKGERVDDAVYPFAQRAGHLWLVALNSSTGNFWAWDSAGSVDAEQLARLERLLGRLEPGPRVLVTHYPVCLASGRPERKTHGLRNASEVVAIAARGGVCLWLHGHRHGGYYVSHSTLAPFPIICAGSVTQRNHGSYGEYTIEGRHLHGVRRAFSPATLGFEDRFSFELELPA